MHLFKRAAALLTASCMMLAGMPAGAVATGAADNTIRITIDRMTVDAADIGKPVPIYIRTDGAPDGFTAMEFGITVDSRCTYKVYTDSDEAKELAHEGLSRMMIVDTDPFTGTLSWNCLASSTSLTRPMNLVLYMVELPETAQAGDTYSIKFSEQNIRGENAAFCRERYKQIDYDFDVENGWITVTETQEPAETELPTETAAPDPVTLQRYETLTVGHVRELSFDAPIESITYPGNTSGAASLSNYDDKIYLSGLHAGTADITVKLISGVICLLHVTVEPAATNATTTAVTQTETTTTTTSTAKATTTTRATTTTQGETTTTTATSTAKATTTTRATTTTQPETTTTTATSTAKATTTTRATTTTQEQTTTTEAAATTTETTPVPTETVVPGNLNDDDTVNASDAALILIAAATLGAGEELEISIAKKAAADVNSDDSINASDAAIVLIFAAAVGSGQKDVKLTDFIKQK
ncbi:MAG: hypothetical protein K5695_07825 [Oscillospiraceae bacterium]|nr:hypothetical protein [Oscillospiraceae bacterium]